MAEVSLPDTGLILTWVEFTDSKNAVHVWSMRALTDPQSYYGGFKEPRVLELGTLARALSDINGTYQGTDFSLVLSDNDRVIRSMLSNAGTKYFLNRSMVVRMIDDVSRRAGLEPRIIMRGLVADYKPQADLQFTFGVQDVITRRFSSQVASLSQVPKRRITKADFPDVPPDKEHQPVPIIYGVCSDQVEYTDVVGDQPKYVFQAHMSRSHVGPAGTWKVKYVVTLVGLEITDPAWAPKNQQDERIMGSIEFADCVGPNEFIHKQRYTMIEWAQPRGFASKLYGRFAATPGQTLAYQGGTFGFLGYIPKIDTGPPTTVVRWSEAWLRASADQFQPPINNMYVDGTFAQGGVIKIDNSQGVIQPIHTGPRRFV